MAMGTRAPPLSERRTQLLELVQKHPGILVSQAAKAIGVCTQTLNHHVTILTKAGLLAEHRSGRYVALYLPDQPRDTVARRAGLAGLYLSRRVRTLRVLHGHPGATTRLIAQVEGTSVSAAYARLQRLRGAGLVQHAGGNDGYHLTPVGEEALSICP